MSDAAREADIADVDRLLRRRFPDWYPQLGPSRCRAFAEMFSELGPADDADLRGISEALAKGDHHMASAKVLLSDWATRTGQRAWRIAQAIRTGVISRSDPES